MALLRANTTFHAPGHVVVDEGSIFDSGDPIVKGREALFDAVEDKVTASRPVEQATARPGSKSAARRPGKKA